jgi:hypothetical protein
MSSHGGGSLSQSAHGTGTSTHGTSMSTMSGHGYLASLSGSSHGSSSSSTHGMSGGVIRIRSVLIDIEDDDVIEDDDFEDSRMELRNAGHNLVRLIVSDISLNYF